MTPRIVIAFWIVMAITALVVLCASAVALRNIRARPGLIVAVAFAWLALAGLLVAAAPPYYIAASLGEPAAEPRAAAAGTTSTADPLDQVFEKVQQRAK
jgi:hypothetical protein